MLFRSMVVALAGLWPLLRGLGIRSWASVGFPRRSDWWRQVLLGAGIGVVSIAVAFLITGRSLDVANAKRSVVGVLGSVFVTAVLVSVVEETFFRGAIQGALQRSGRWPVALVVASVIYSALHFLKPSGVFIAPADVRWWSGFVCLGKIVSGSLLAADVGVAFVTLLLVGLILGWTFVQSEALYWAIGLHGGWVVANEFIRKFKGGNIVQTPVAWAVLVVTWVVVAWLCRSQRKS